MKRQNSITNEQFTNFLASGAVLRQGEQWWLFADPQLCSNPLKTQGFLTYSSDFFSPAEGAWIEWGSVYSLEAEQMRALVAGNVDRQVEFNWSQPREDDFKTVFADIKSRIAREELHKAVPAVFEVSKQTLTPSELRICLAHLVSAASSVIVYGMWYDGKGILGATPETLFTLTENELATMALAGTLPKSPFASPQQLIEDPKERHEHDLVVQDLAHQLSGLGRVDKGTLEVLELPHLFHLRTLLKVRLPRAVHADEMLRLLHPTPALGVSPRQYGYHWLSRFAQQELRSRFGAPLVFSLGGELTLALVAIRNVQWNSEGTVLGSGCGIVAESELAKEWLELKAKRDSVKKLLGFKL